MDDVFLETGQVWGLTDSRILVIILCVETIMDEEIVHVGVFNCEDDEHPLHMPFSIQAFKDSIDTLITTQEEFVFPAGGYNYWKKEFMAKKAGVYDICVGEVLKL